MNLRRKRGEGRETIGSEEISEQPAPSGEPTGYPAHRSLGEGGAPRSDSCSALPPSSAEIRLRIAALTRELDDALDLEWQAEQGGKAALAASVEALRLDARIARYEATLAERDSLAATVGRKRATETLLIEHRQKCEADLAQAVETGEAPALLEARRALTDAEAAHGALTMSLDSDSLRLADLDHELAREDVVTLRQLHEIALSRAGNLAEAFAALPEPQRHRPKEPDFTTLALGVVAALMEENQRLLQLTPEALARAEHRKWQEEVTRAAHALQLAAARQDHPRTREELRGLTPASR